MSKRIFLLIVPLLLIPILVHADVASDCQQVSAADTNACQNLSSADCRVLLEKCAAFYDDQSAAIAKDLTKTTQQKNTLQSAVSSLKKKITSLEGQISRGTLMVKDLNIQISDTQVSIDNTVKKIEDSQNQIATILREIYIQDHKPTLAVLMEGNLSDYFGNVTRLESLNSRVSSLLESTTSLKSYLEGQRQKQESERGRLQKTIQIQSLQKQENEQNKKQQEGYLKLTEAQYQKQLADKQDVDKKAAAIRSRIFELLGVSKAPTFGEAYAIAKYVSGVTGVRPALVMAILTQESNLGKNVGQCYVTDFATGSGTSLQGSPKSRVMNPKTIPSFVSLTQSLGMDPQHTAVSCWIPLYSRGAPYGWGGAMGPGQFIASTWDLYSGKVTQITGAAANPWNIRDAFLASGLLLRDNGAGGSEFNAAAKYYCGGSYGRYECRAYANSVLSIANSYESDIRAIGG